MVTGRNRNCGVQENVVVRNLLIIYRWIDGKDVPVVLIDSLVGKPLQGSQLWTKQATDQVLLGS